MNDEMMIPKPTNTEPESRLSHLVFIPQVTQMHVLELSFTGQHGRSDGLRHLVSRADPEAILEKNVNVAELYRRQHMPGLSFLLLVAWTINAALLEILSPPGLSSLSSRSGLGVAGEPPSGFRLVYAVEEPVQAPTSQNAMVLIASISTRRTGAPSKAEPR
jgi:hypothetical protein